MPSLTITSFNAQWGRGPGDQPFDLTKAVAGFDTDVVVVQEVWNPDEGPAALADAAEAGGYQRIEQPQADSYVDPQPEITDRPELAAGTWGITVLSRVPLLNVRSPELGHWTRRWDVARRRAIVADLDLGDNRVSIAAVHLSFVLPNAWHQLRTLDAELPGDRPTIVVGDCNLWGPVAERAARRRRAVRGRTWPAHRPHSQLDHILVSAGVKVTQGMVLANAGSDHRPIRATLRFP